MSKSDKKVAERAHYMTADDRAKMNGKKRLHSIMREVLGVARKGKTAKDRALRGL